MCDRMPQIDTNKYLRFCLFFCDILAPGAAKTRTTTKEELHQSVSINNMWQQIG